MRNNWRRPGVALCGLLLVLYFGSYIVLSRRGYTEADQFHIKGFYYLAPENSDGWRLKNSACVIVFEPLNAVDRWSGSGRAPACEPFWKLHD